jgi:sucrose phosphorylase
MLALAGVPGIYVHSLFGSHNDQAGYAASGWKRDLNHEKLSLAEVERRLSDPSSETARVFAGYRRLLEVRRAQPAFHPAAPQTILNLGGPIFGLRRGPRDGQTIVALHNVSGGSLEVELSAFGLKDVPAATDLLSGETFTSSSMFKLAPYGVRWLAVQEAGGG